MTLTYKRNLEFRDSDDERSWMRIACADVKQSPSDDTQRSIVLN